MTILVKRSSFPEFDSIERQFRGLFGGLPLTAVVPAAVPAADVYETPTEFVVELEVPGFVENELAVEISDHVLTLAGRRDESKQETEKTYRLQERLEQGFKREFRMPPQADTGHVTARFDHGVLEVHAPKLATVEPHRVTISKK
jgi:HSP20 family protein